jgi:NAD(P)H-hydrate epimerase
MEHLPEALYRAADVREFDRRATAMEGGSAEIAGAAFPPAEQHGLGGGALMERAGSAALHVLRERFPRARRLLVVCGPGNNGGDGYVLARRAQESGLDVTTQHIADPETLKGDARAAWQRWQAAGGQTAEFDPVAFAQADVVVDALFGTGLERALEGRWRDAVATINAGASPVLALDIPSGLHADTGRVLGVAVRASVTVSFIALKAGVFTAQGREHSGVIVFDDLMVPDAVLQGTTPLARRITHAALRGLLRPLPRHAHKGMAGRVLVIGGKPGMPGAVQLAGTAAYRAGAGLVTVATHGSHAAAISAARPELIAHGMHAPVELMPLMMQASAIALGPGLGQDEWGMGLWMVASGSERPLVLDADALNLLARHPARRADWILTPHPGEAARLLGVTVSDIEVDRFAATRALASRYGGVCVLKGSGTVIAMDGRTELWLCDRGNPGMATGGSGDVLAGAIAALLARGLAPIDAARLGVYAHAVAGDRAVRRGERGLLAGDLMLPLRDVLNELVRTD